MNTQLNHIFSNFIVPKMLFTYFCVHVLKKIKTLMYIYRIYKCTHDVVMKPIHHNDGVSCVCVCV